MADESAVSQQLIARFQRAVYLMGLGLNILILTIGMVGWHQLWWGMMIGMGLGLGSFHILTITVSSMQSGSNKALMAKGVVLSMFKIIGLFLIIWLLYGLGLNLIQVLGGLLSSQLGIVGAVAVIMSDLKKSETGTTHA
ncbi:hypothetical protein KBA41_04305 [Candidatus Ozemobacteraceae bacterium]|nr:hypothetical protein [Candidatus Ozemobacteraceae bacterium]